MEQSSEKTRPTLDGKKKKKGGPGRPFTKDDPRINRKGRPLQPSPKTKKQLNQLIDEILSMPSSKNKKINMIEQALLNLLKTGGGTQYVIDRRFGKTPTPIDLNMLAIFQQINLEALPLELLDRIAKNDVSVLGELIGTQKELPDVVENVAEGGVKDEDKDKD